jgi:hypothetical protein
MPLMAYSPLGGPDAGLLRPHGRSGSISIDAAAAPYRRYPRLRLNEYTSDLAEVTREGKRQMAFCGEQSLRAARRGRTNERDRLRAPVARCPAPKTINRRHHESNSSTT